MERNMDTLGPGLRMLIAAGIFVAAGAAELHHASAPQVRLYAMTELTAGDRGHFLVKAHVNGHGIRALVDTGASSVALTYRDAEYIGLKPKNLNFDVPVKTANGIGYAAEVLLRNVEVDGVKVDNVTGFVLQDGMSDVTLLGMSYLSKLRGFSVENGKMILKN
jgi:aspartyl protease family protein